MRNFLKNALVTTAIAGAALTAAGAASADIACNSNGDCWHVAKRYTTYPASVGVTFYPDTWREEHVRDTHYHWYDRDDDHGYYVHGEWHAFDHD